MRKIARESRRKFEAGRAVLLVGKVINKPVVTKFWINGRASEDRDECIEEVRGHCERCYDDKAETSEVQKLGGSGVRGLVAIAVQLSISVGCRSQLTKFPVLEGR